jgi:hypothetical protein
MMDLKWDGRDVCVTLRDDVWQLGEPGTLCLTRTQAQLLRIHLNELANSAKYEFEPEDG